MKRILFVLVAILVTGNVLMAQERRDIRTMSDREWIDHMTDEMSNHYSLNADQRARLDRLNDEMRPKIDQVETRYQRGNMSAQERDRLENEMRDYHRQYDERIKDILDNNQYDRYKKSRTERESANQLRREVRHNR
ncbi:MAG: hypothetical protein LUF04_00980 [Bacteroides sp.]|nr:hypothetical protein [Bacteroides sp.]